MYSQKYYDKTKYEDDILDGIAVELSGIESFKDKSKIRVKKIFNENILGYMVANQSGFDNPDLNSGLTTCGIYAGNGFFLRKENYLEKLPMFSESRYITYNRKWTERTLIMKSADGFDKFNEDVNNKNLEQFLLKNMLFCSLEMKNHMRSFNGSDGRNYRNELCLDTNNGMTIAVNDLKKLVKGSKEKESLLQWAMVLKVAKKTKKYKKNITYGVYQIWNELNTSYRDEKKDITIYDYPELNGHLLTLKSLLKDYYLTEIVPTLFEYES